MSANIILFGSQVGQTRAHRRVIRIRRSQGSVLGDFGPLVELRLGNVRSARHVWHASVRASMCSIFKARSLSVRAQWFAGVDHLWWDELARRFLSFFDFAFV